MNKKREKSLKMNMVLNAINGIMKIIFPLITFPYSSRILGVEGIGKSNFASSIVSYFILLAGLGIASYAVREGTQFREKNTFQRFVNEMFTINVVSTVVAYILLMILMIMMNNLKPYYVLIMIFSIEIIFRAIGVEWIYTIYEDFAYITGRSIVFQVLSLVALVLFVKSENDVWIYAIITVIASAGSNLLNFWFSRKYCKLRVCRFEDCKRHLKPIFVLFAMSATVTIYVSIGITILGFFTNDYHVGIYTSSSKVYGIIKNIPASILFVAIPRLSLLLKKDNKNEFEIVALDIYKTLLTIVLPTVLGICLLRQEIVFLIAGEAYMEASKSLVLLAFALLPCMGAIFWQQCILIPLKKENLVLKVTLISAIVNIVCNLVFVPILQERAAAFATLLSETISLVACAKYGGKYVKLSGIGTVTAKILAGCVAIVVVCIGGKILIENTMIYTVVAVVLSVGLYFVIEVVLKNEALQGFRKMVLRKR